MAEATLASIADHPLYSIDPELLETAAAGFESMGSSVRDNGAAVVSAWTPLSAHYAGPGDAELFATMTPVGTTSTSVGDNFDSVAAALRTFKTTADEVKASMDQLKLDHAALKHSIDTFEPTIEDGPMSYDAKSTMNWYDDESLRSENTRIIQELSNCLEKMHEAERTCANTIRGLHGLSALTAGDGGYTSGEYGVDEIADEAETPWGTAAFDDESCGESAWNTTVGLGQDLLGLAGLIGMKWDWDNGGDFSWNLDNAGDTYAGFAALIGRDPETGDWSLGNAGETWLGMGKEFVAWDRWSENPNAAFGQVFVNGVSSIGVVGIVGKISKVGRGGSAGHHSPDRDSDTNGADGSQFDYTGVRSDSVDVDSVTPDFDGIDFDLEINKILDSETDLDTSRPYQDTDVPPVRDADTTPGDGTPDRADSSDGRQNTDNDTTGTTTGDSDAPANETPADSTPGDDTPADSTPGDDTPADTTPDGDTAFTPDASGTDTVQLDNGETVVVRDLDGDGTPDEIVDDAPTDHTPSDGITPEQQQRIDSYQKWGEHAPEWLQPLIQGRIFNVEQWHRFDANEVYLDHPDGSRTILDSYTPDEAVISRKNTMLGEVQPATAKAYIDEFAKKYPTDGRVTIADTPSTRANPALADRIGDALSGEMRLEVPVQRDRVTGEPIPVPQEVLRYATLKGIDIVDTSGHYYN
jgi:hypothetical protein